MLEAQPLVIPIAEVIVYSWYFFPQNYISFLLEEALIGSWQVLGYVEGFVKGRDLKKRIL